MHLLWCSRPLNPRPKAQFNNLVNFWGKTSPTSCKRNTRGGRRGGARCIYCPQNNRGKQIRSAHHSEYTLTVAGCPYLPAAVNATQPPLLPPRVFLFQLVGGGFALKFDQKIRFSFRPWIWRRRTWLEVHKGSLSSLLLSFSSLLLFLDLDPSWIGERKIGLLGVLHYG